MKLSFLKSINLKSILRFIFKPFVLVLIIAIVGITASVFLYRQNQQTTKQLEALKSSPQTYAEEQNRKLISKVGTLIELPKGENPTLATITDASKIKDQPFFSQAENGDNVLIYVQAKKAILYRSSINRVIDVAPVNISSSSAQPAPVITPISTPKVTR
jgi:predicted negative regulator of RcsB-dependent stress response